MRCETLGALHFTLHSRSILKTSVLVNYTLPYRVDGVVVATSDSFSLALSVTGRDRVTIGSTSDGKGIPPDRVGVCV